MNIAIASGKGGTGKTTVAVALAEAADEQTLFLDCDVEEPNASLFIQVENGTEVPVNVLVPSVDESKCTGCGKCSTACQFNAIAVMASSVMVFNEMCHSCGGCSLVCPEKAICEVEHKIGEIKCGGIRQIHFAEGRLDIGNTMAPPIIREVKKKVEYFNEINCDVIIDCPPGTSCPMITAVKGTDFVVLVAEPTPFGLNDLKLAIETVKTLGLRFGVVINKAGSGDSCVFEYCRDNNIEVLLEVPDSREVAEAYSNGKGLIEADKGMKELFRNLLSDIRERCGETV